MEFWVVVWYDTSSYPEDYIFHFVWAGFFFFSPQLHVNIHNFFLQRIKPLLVDELLLFLAWIGTFSVIVGKLLGVVLFHVFLLGHLFYILFLVW